MKGFGKVDLLDFEVVVHLAEPTEGVKVMVKVEKKEIEMEPSSADLWGK
jgi:NADH:ubiquinone oxidoreductase subunit C